MSKSILFQINTCIFNLLLERRQFPVILHVYKPKVTGSVQYLAKFLKLIIAHVSIKKVLFFPRLRNICDIIVPELGIHLIPFLRLQNCGMFEEHSLHSEIFTVTGQPAWGCFLS